MLRVRSRRAGCTRSASISLRSTCRSSAIPTYGVREPPLERQFLHATALAFPHPFAGERIETVSELPPDLAAFLAGLS